MDFRTLLNEETRVTRIGVGTDANRNVYAPSKVVRMPDGDHSTVAQFLRYHVLIRVYDGDADAWLTRLQEQGGDEGDVRFARWIRSRVRKDPALLGTIRRMVEATPFWRQVSSRA